MGAQKLQKAEAALQSPSLSRTTRKLYCLPGKARVNHLRISVIFPYTIARAPSGGGSVMKETVTKCAFLRFLGLHILESERPGCSKPRPLRDPLEWTENSAKTWFHLVLYSFAPNSKFVNYTFSAVTVAMSRLYCQSL